MYLNSSLFKRKKMNVDVIGGSGFIGTRLIKRLMNSSDTKVKIIDKISSATFPELATIGDVRSFEEIMSSLTEQSVLINLAAEHRDDVRPLSLYDDVNVGGAVNICKAAVEKKDERTLVIIRPTVVFGEQNRGNVYNLLRQIASGHFMMIVNGENRKSMAYVENLTAFIEYSMKFLPGVHIYNFIDKPDFTMNALVLNVNKILGKSERIGIRLPIFLGLGVGKIFDLLANISGKKFSISSIRVKKFCANSVYNTAISETGFIHPVPLESALKRTVLHEFVEKNSTDTLFYSE